MIGMSVTLVVTLLVMIFAATVVLLFALADLAVAKLRSWVRKRWKQ